MGRWLMLSIVAIALAGMLAACGGEEGTGTASPAGTPVWTATRAVTETAIATARPSTPSPIATLARTATSVVTQTATATARPSTPSPTAAAPAPTPRPTTPTPEPTQQVRQPVWTVSQLSGEDQVQIMVGDGVNTYNVASLDPEWAQFDKWDIEFVADVNADGVVEAIAGHFTGGAHCCFEYLIFSETPSGIQLDDWFSLGNGGIGSVKDLDGDGLLELEGSDDRFAYFADLPFAGSPFLPLVLCRSADATYSDCTTRFPEKLRESADEFEGHLRDAVQRQAEEPEQHWAALGLVASYLRLGRNDEGWSRVRSLCPECETWLLQNQDELEDRLSYVSPTPPIQPPQ